MIRILLALCLSSQAVLTAVADDWPQWRGTNRDGISGERGLLQEWSEDGPPIRWTARDIGSGYSTPSIADGRVFVQTNDEEQEFALALDEKTGEELWLTPIGTVGRNRGPQYPGTRSTPTVDGDRIYCLASGGELVCLEAATGNRIWDVSFKEDFEGVDGAWAYSESVLVDGNAVICTPGGSTASLAALNKMNGEMIWTSQASDAGSAEYASVMVVDALPTKIYVQFLRKGLVGVAADSGEFLWLYGNTIDPGANILTPIVEGKRIYTAGSRTGGSVIELGDDAKATPEELYFDRALGASIGGAVLIDDYLYGTSRSAMFCAEFSTGEIKWTERALGAASICYADGRLYVRSHDGAEVALVEPSPEGYHEMGRFEQTERSETRAWPHPVVANGALYIRDEGVLHCYDVRLRTATRAASPRAGD